MIADGSLEVGPLATERFSFDRANQAYEVLLARSALGILIEYPHASAVEDSLRRRTIPVNLSPRSVSRSAELVAAVIGAGNFATRSLLPALQNAGIRVKTVVSAGGINGTRLAQKFGAEQSSTNSSSAIADPQVNLVVVATRHDSHAALACAALEAGKHVFVEKPLALNLAELEQIENVYAKVARNSGIILMVGFNRRFSPLTQKLKNLLDNTPGTKSFIITVNAGEVPREHWTRDLRTGGGRVIGEVCHFVDLARFLAGRIITGVQATGSGESSESVCFTLRFEDGSFASINYLDNGPNSFPKERIEVFTAGRALVLCNFRKLVGYNWPSFNRLRLWRQDKGHNAIVAAFAEAIRKGQPSPIAFNELSEVTRTTMQIAAATR
ncbi:MAG: Gfo/Idh/MocA family oxidoreductase, partial [Deltaproteobacteria bacterium]|nr:Gfo/Idh/MocA family oxidoreductase [Deltaproteobacteria bacterium]